MVVTRNIQVSPTNPAGLLDSRVYFLLQTFNTAGIFKDLYLLSLNATWYELKIKIIIIIDLK